MNAIWALMSVILLPPAPTALVVMIVSVNWDILVMDTTALVRFE